MSKKTWDDYGTPSSAFTLIKDFPPGYWDNPTIYNKFEPEHSSDFYWHNDVSYNEIDLSEYDYIIREVENEKLLSFKYNNKKFLVIIPKSWNPEKNPKLHVRDTRRFKECYDESYFDGKYDYILDNEFIC